MALPQSELNRIKIVEEFYSRTPLIEDSDIKYLIHVAQTDPTALDSIVSIMTDYFNRGLISTTFIPRTVDCLISLAKISEYLRAKIATAISGEVLDFHCSDYAEPRLRGYTQELLKVLKVERPKHYFDLCRKILTSNGSIFIIGAGFSYHSYTPLLIEMEGIACSTLYDLGVDNPRHLYKANEQKAWEVIAGGWQTFQKHVAFTLLPKEPSDQHIILAELFQAAHITHIVSFNWDDLIEKAYKNLYNADIPKITKEDTESDHALWKLHGDIANPGERWVLPFEEGKVFHALQQIISKTTIPTISIGYREQERVVRERLLSVLENRGGITRIRPDLSNNPPKTFEDNSLMAMKKIKDAMEAAKKSVYPA
jgi:hypothetical protein